MNPSPVNPNRRVLVIDDNRSIHDDFRKILCPAAAAAAAALDATEAAVLGRPTKRVRPIEFEVDSAYQGQEGVLRVKEALEAGRPYALAFVDVRMPPGWDGVETTRKLWELDPNLQVVLCTAYSDYSWGELFEKLGHSDGLLILKKPFDGVEALQLAHALTEKWWLHQQSRRKMEELESRVAERTRELQHLNHALQAEIVEHNRTEQALRDSREELLRLLNSMTEGAYGIDTQGNCTFVNRAFLEVLGYPDAQELLGQPIHELIHHAHDDGRPYPASECKIYSALKTLQAVNVADEVFWRKDGAAIPVEYWSHPIVKNGVAIGSIVTFIDITQRKQLDAQLLQSQKMETVGRLAGGVAHEFNSIMTVIIGQSELLLHDLLPGNPLCLNATEIRAAAERAATLTRQLLAYGRKQFLQPVLLDLNSVLAGMESTLRHLLVGGADVCLAPAAGLKAVKADAGQIEQVILNVAMNAAEAMPQGGLLTLATANVTLDQAYVSPFPELKAGKYVMLAITDTGAGMTADVKARIFEPFFTTKGVCQGTGLGLSTCYGIVKQSGGHLSVDSELGRGTTFKIYLPQVEPPPTPTPPRLKSTDLPRGTEIILHVEDNAALRQMTVMLLRRLGYTVLAAGNGLEALSLIQQRGLEPIDVLFTDVVMPQMDGKELSERVRFLYPHIRILFTSGYTEDALFHQGVLTEGVVLLPKPFTPSALAHKLREVLRPPSASPADPAPNKTESDA